MIDLSSVSPTNTLRELMSYTASLKARIEDLLIDSDGEIIPEIENLMNELTHVTGVSLAAKVDSIRGIVDSILAQSEVDEKYEAVYYRLKRGRREVARRLKDWVKFNMIQSGQTLLEGNHFTYKLVHSQPSLEIDETRLPDAYFIEVRTLSPDRERILQELKDGIEVPGAKLIPTHALRPGVRKQPK
jgi:hypothetical protein